ncbi:MAG: beta-N-acetylhexosaminidase [Hyphomicrobiaceae bacterium]|nr:beta-N-acetylhexosaminidase [Hyphomicrobiaceae bacterium]
MLTAFMTGLSGPVITADECAFLTDSRPAGLILFARNCQSPDQIRKLVAGFREAVGTERVLVLIDQEGGRVQRLRPPLGSLLPAAASFLGYASGDVVEAARLARLAARLAAHELSGYGINTNCAPVLDVPVAGAHDVIGNRAYAHDAATVTALGTAVADGLMAGAIVPVAKHVPGHGRAGADSHLELPVVATPREILAATDFLPFRTLAHLPAAMTAHVVYTALDPARPASISASVTRGIIRGEIGFDGLLMSDDLGMRALAGSFESRTRAVLTAGSDLALHCSGALPEMQAVASAAPALAGESLRRFERALRVALAPPMPFDAEAARAALAPLLARAA